MAAEKFAGQTSLPARALSAEAGCADARLTARLKTSQVAAEVMRLTSKSGIGNKSEPPHVGCCFLSGLCCRVCFSPGQPADQVAPQLGHFPPQEDAKGQRGRRGQRQFNPRQVSSGRCLKNAQAHQ